jgi:hypothetical protein
METAPISRMFCLLALGLGSSFISPATLAIPNSASPAITTPKPLGTAPNSLQQPAPPADGAADGNEATGAALATSVSVPNPAPQPATDAVASPSSTPCLTYFVSDQTPAADSDTCAEPDTVDQRFSLQFGRGFATRSGVMGRFDGLLVDYRLTSGITLNAVAGGPVVSGQEASDLTKQVFGLSATTGKFARAWDLNGYIAQQQNNGRIESRAVGGALRYLRPTHSLLVSLDYDMDEDSLSSVVVSGAWKLLRATTLSATFDIRHSYMHTPQAGYLQQTMAATEGWKWALPMDRIKQLAGKRSTEVKTLGLGLSHAFSQRIKLSGDFAVLDVWRDTALGDPNGVAAQSSEYFYRLKLTGEDLVLSGDNSTLDLRHSVTGSSRVSSASLDTRYAINRLWQINPRLRTDYRDNEQDSSVQWVTSPMVKMEYRWREQYGIDIEAGREWSARKLPAADQVRSTYFLSLGYRANF